MAKKFPTKVMEYELRGKVTEGMWKKVKTRIQDFDSQAAYLRFLIMNDLKINEYGK